MLSYAPLLRECGGLCRIAGSRMGSRHVQVQGLDVFVGECKVARQAKLREEVVHCPELCKREIGSRSDLAAAFRVIERKPQSDCCVGGKTLLHVANSVTDSNCAGVLSL